MKEGADIRSPKSDDYVDWLTSLLIIVVIFL